MTQTELAPSSAPFRTRCGQLPQAAVPRQRRPVNEYAHLAPLFTDLARLPEGHRRAAVRDRLITELLPVARHIARRFVGRGEPLQDLEQVTVLGLIRAVDRFDPDRGPDFLAFAVPTITGEVRRWFRDRTWSMRVPRRLKELDASISTAVGQLSQELCRAPRPSEIAIRLEIAVSDVIDGLQVHDAYRCRSLDEPLGTEPEDEPLHLDTLGELDPGVALVEDREALGPLLDSLAERERRIVLLRFFGDMTQSQIAREIGISQMHVSRLLTATLKKMRSAMTGDIP
jgi:RNA polymerase sigma-B factor